MSQSTTLHMEDTLNTKQREVYDAWMDTTDNIFCTGHGGTGKSWVLKCICAKMRQSADTVFAITAPTGAAALDIGGMTINRFAGIGIETENIGNMIARASNGPAAESWKKTNVLIIDEISMVSGIFFENLNLVAKHIRKSNEPFGGIRLLILGDFLQLPPVSKYSFRPFRAFECESWKQCNIKQIVLTETVRQTDIEFTNILSYIRMGVCTQEVNDYILACEREITYDDDIQPVRLFALKKYVNTYNSIMLEQIHKRSHTFTSTDSGNTSALSDCSAPQVLTLKKGAQVMVIRNLSRHVVNGTVGVVREFVIRNNREVPVIEVVTTAGSLISVTLSPETWESTGPTGNIIATRIQIPLILAWAITIHKSQGKSIPRLYVDMAGIFEVGQAYVALSRCESPQNLQVVNYTPECVKVDTPCVEFYNTLTGPNIPLEDNPPAYTETQAQSRTLPPYTEGQESATRVAEHTNEEWVDHTVSTRLMMEGLSITEHDQETSETLEYGSEV